MTTNAKKTKAKRSHKDHPNKADRKREKNNRENMKKFAADDK